MTSPRAGSLARTILGWRTAGAFLAVAAIHVPLEAGRPKRTVIQELDAELGWVMVPNQVHHDQFLRTEERINAYGFRGSDWSPEPEPGVTRIAVLGSSMTYGSCVDFERIYPTRLESRLREAGIAAEVLDCAVQGYVLEQSMLNYRHRVRALRPGVVVVAFADQDVKPFVRYGVPPRGDLRPDLTRTEFYRRFQYELQPALRRLAPENPEPPWVAARKAEESRKNGLLNEQLAVDPFTPEVMPLWERARGTMEELLRDVRADGAQLVITVLPQRPQAIDPSIPGPDVVWKRFAASREGCTYVDVIEDLRSSMAPLRARLETARTPEERWAALHLAVAEHPAEAYLRDKGGHFGEHGMEVIASALARGLEPLLRP